MNIFKLFAKKPTEADIRKDINSATNDARATAKETKGPSLASVTFNYEDDSTETVKPEEGTALVVQYTKETEDKKGSMTSQKGWTKCNAHVLLHVIANLGAIREQISKSLVNSVMAAADK